MTFKNKDDYNLIFEDDLFNIINLNKFSPRKNLTIDMIHPDGTCDSIQATHTYNENQIKWFKAGSSLNLISHK